jgi:hypothetical protein
LATEPQASAIKAGIQTYRWFIVFLSLFAAQAARL